MLPQRQHAKIVVLALIPISRVSTSVLTALQVRTVLLLELLMPLHALLVRLVFTAR